MRKYGILSLMLAAMAVALIPAAHAQREIILDQILVLSDASGSTSASDVGDQVETITKNFVGAFPDGSYEAGLSSFAGMTGVKTVFQPLEGYNASAMRGAASQVKYLGGGTPLSEAIMLAGEQYQGKSGYGAIWIISDGEIDVSASVRAIKSIQSLHNGQVCVHTVHVGGDSFGASNLKALTRAAGCGGNWTAEQVSSSGGMSQMVDVVFYGTQMPAKAVVDGDADGDGVPDSIDECPDTPKGAKVDARGCWTLRGLNFDFDKAEIKPEFFSLLDEVANVIKQNQGFNIRVDGHTDSSGAESYNQALSLRRANAVRKALLDRGVKTDRLTVKGFGETSPSHPNDTDQNRYMNRRVELTIVQ